MQGKVIFLNNEKYKWTNHDYGEKTSRATTQKIFKYIAYFIRRINIFYFYLSKIIMENKINYNFSSFFINFY